MKEIRNLNPEVAEVRASEDKRQLSGYAIVFNSRSNPIMGEGGFTEIIKPEAINGVLPKSDVLALLNHDESRGVLARSKYGKGTLTLTVDSKGVRYDFEAPKTALGEEVLEGVRRGDISASSFAFTVAEDEWEKRSDGSYERTITKLERIYDVSPVYTEAYSDTTVAVRSLQEFRSGEVNQPVVDNTTTPPEKEKPVEKNVEPEVKHEAKPTLDELSRHYEILEEKMKNY